MPGADILAVAVADDELGTLSAIRRTLGYYTGAERTVALLHPADCGRRAIIHFHLSHDSHAEGFWREALIWLRDGQNPWPQRVTLRADPAPGGERAWSRLSSAPSSSSF
ncbi:MULTISPECIES: hypothetical protein [Paracoccus]|uniref:hypothetical protein n=1 Tax=Paracoccus TaxID=265 RepID=UPI001FB6F616|nr:MULTISPECIES: hypothetical protein [Paracoccus]MCJ1902896.1 hypothetical protein [Paracoccus versutus]MDF3907426.1 hypothetical protein [Paracoccus sp. AS002]